MENFVRQLGTCQNTFCNKNSTVIWQAHQRKLCSMCAILFHCNCNLKVKLELDYVDEFLAITIEILERMIQLYEEYDELRTNFPFYKTDLDNLIQSFNDWKTKLENPPPDIGNISDKIPHCIDLMIKLQDSQAYNKDQ